jgi:hypothetical protein
MAKVRGIATDPNQDAREAANILGNLNSRASQEKLGMILDPVQQAQLQTQIDQASRAIQLRANMTTNSKTFGRMVQQQAAQAQNPGGVIDAVTAGRAMDIPRRIIQGITGNTPARALGREDAMNQQIAELLTTAQGQAAQDRMQILQQIQTPVARNAAIAQQVGGTTATGAGLAGYQTGFPANYALRLLTGLLGGGG